MQTKEITNEYPREGLTISRYNSIHIWIKRHHGKATRCEMCFSNSAKRFEWALIKGMAYEKNISNYIQLCPKCHRFYDMTTKQKEKRGPMSSLTKAKISKSKTGKRSNKRIAVGLFDDHNVLKASFHSMTEAARAFNIKVSTISNNVLGFSKKTKQGIWKRI